MTLLLLFLVFPLHSTSKLCNLETIKILVLHTTCTTVGIF